MLRVEHLKIGRLPPLSFSVQNGECLAIEGPSGSGKTRLLRAIADLDPSEGHILLDGLAREEAPATAWRKLVRYAAAEPAWWSDTPRASLPATFLASERLNRLCHALDLSPALLDRAVGELSTGERQRLALIRAIADEPRVLLLDEPTAALDAASAALVEELIRFLVLSGRSVLLVSHDPAQIARLADARLQLAAPNGAPSGASAPSRTTPGAP